MIKFKRLFYVTMGCIAAILLLIVGVVVAVDPYQQYRKSDVFILNQRLENPGVAKHHDYDAVIVGSSMSMNHYPSQVDSLFRWNTINLTTKGGLDADYYLLFPHLIRQGKVKHMVWGIDFFSYALPVTFSAEPYLYDNKWWNDFPYWFNYTSFENSYKKIRTNELVSRDEISHFDSHLGRQYLLKYYERDNNELYFKKYDFTAMKSRFDKMMDSLIPIMEDVELYIYFTPYSILEFKMFEQYGHWEQVLDFKRYMIGRLLEYPNVKLYDFQKEEFICNLDEYMDLRHHSHAYNKRVIEYMHKDSCRVREDNYIKDLAVLDSLVRLYRIELN